MSVLDEFDTGPAAGLAPAVVREHKNIELTPQDKVTLVQFYHSNNYQVVLKLMEGEITKAETDHFKRWRDKDEFERTGLLAVSMRIFFERIQTEINRQVEEFAGELEFARSKKKELETSPEEQVQNSFK